jgi:hypothetical protein
MSMICLYKVRPSVYIKFACIPLLLLLWIARVQWGKPFNPLVIHLHSSPLTEVSDNNNPPDDVFDDPPT